MAQATQLSLFDIIEPVPLAQALPAILCPVLPVLADEAQQAVVDEHESELEQAKTYFKKYHLELEAKRAKAREEAALNPVDYYDPNSLALVVMSGTAGFSGALFATTKEAGLYFCGLEGTYGRGKFGEWSTFCVNRDLEDYDKFINDDGRFNTLINQNNIPVFFCVPKRGGGTTKVSDWLKKARKNKEKWNTPTA